MVTANPVIYSIDDLRKAASDLGSHFFDADTMRFFHSRVLEGIYRPSIDESPRAGLFVTSEANRTPYYPDEPRLYTVRRFTITRLPGADLYPAQDQITFDTVGEFQQYETARAAKRAAAQLVESGAWNA